MEMNSKVTRRTFSFKKNFLVGVLFSGPIVATVWVLDFVWKLVWKTTTGWIPKSWLNAAVIDSVGREMLLKGVSFVAVLLGLYLLGLLLTHFVGRRLLTWSDKVLMNLPIVRSVYVFFRQISGWIASRRSSVFQSVVLVEYPRKGSFALGFVTCEAEPRISQKGTQALGCDSTFLSVFIPTTPNPTSGYLLFYKEEEVTPLDIDVREAINLVMSAGVIHSDGGMKDSYLDTLHRSVQDEEEEIRS